MHRPLAVMLTRTMEDQADGPFATGEEGQQRTSHAPNETPLPLTPLPSPPRSFTQPKFRKKEVKLEDLIVDADDNAAAERAHSGDSLVVNPVVAAKMALESAEGRTHGDHKLRPGARGALKKLFGKVHAHMKRHAAKPAQPLSNSLAPDNPLTLTLSLPPTVARQEGRQDTGPEEARQDRHARPRLE